MRVIIDRFEGEFAVVEYMEKKTVNMPKVLLPKTAKPGDVVDIVINQEETQKRNKTVKKLMDEVFE